MSKIAVLGGGLSGRLIAFQLAEQGVAVELFEKGERNGAQAAAYVAAAMLAPSSEAVEATPEVIRLGRQSFALWHGILGRLNTPVMMQENGSLIVWHTQDKPLSAEFARHLKRGGVAEHETIRWNADEIAANEPQLAGRFSDGLYLTGFARRIVFRAPNRVSQPTVRYCLIAGAHPAAGGSPPY